MIELPPPLLLHTPVIVRPLEGGLWPDVDRKMLLLGLPREVRRSIIVEMKRVIGGKDADVRAIADEMARHGDDKRLGSMLLNPFAVSPAAPAGDPYFSNVVLLAGFNGTNGATTTVDDSPSAHTSTFNGGAVIDTSQAKFGASSARIPNGGYVQYPSGQSDWAWLTSPFTIEGFWRWSTVSGNPCLIGQMGADRWMIYYDSTSSILYRDGNANFSAGFGTTFTPSTGVWYYIVVDRDASNVIRTYVNGTMRGKTNFNINQPAGSDPLTVGIRYGGSSSFNFDGWADEIRITKGVARYGSDSGCAVPTAAFPRS